MKKLDSPFTGLQRHLIYKRALEIYERKWHRALGLCYSMKHAMYQLDDELKLNAEHYDNHYDSTFKDFPELNALAPLDERGNIPAYWFSPYECNQRIAILNKVIKKTEKYAENDSQT